MSEIYTALDQLVLERWTDVVGLVRAHKDVQSRMDEALEWVGDRLRQWSAARGFQFETNLGEGEFHAWREGWVTKKKPPRAIFAIGGVWPNGYRKLEQPFPYLCLYTENLLQYKIAEGHRAALGRAIREGVANPAMWEDDVDDAVCPLSRYLREFDETARAGLIANPERLLALSKEQFEILFGMADIVEPQLLKV